MAVDRHAAEQDSNHQYDRSDDRPFWPLSEGDHAGHCQRLPPGLGLAVVVGSGITDLEPVLERAYRELQQNIDNRRQQGEWKPDKPNAEHQNAGIVRQLVHRRVQQLPEPGSTAEIHPLPQAHSLLNLPVEHSSLPARPPAIKCVQQHASTEAVAAVPELTDRKQVDHRRVKDEPKGRDPVRCEGDPRRRSTGFCIW